MLLESLIYSIDEKADSSFQPNYDDLGESFVICNGLEGVFVYSQDEWNSLLLN